MVATNDTSRKPYPPQWIPANPCNERMLDFFHYVTTYCTRPAGHDGDHWPVPLAGDRPSDVA